MEFYNVLTCLGFFCGSYSISFLKCFYLPKKNNFTLICCWLSSLNPEILYYRKMFVMFFFFFLLFSWWLWSVASFGRACTFQMKQRVVINFVLKFWLWFYCRKFIFFLSWKHWNIYFYTQNFIYGFISLVNLVKSL